jgi:hypothetical protein
MRGIKAGVRFGYAEAGAVLSADQRRQHPSLLFVGAEADHRLWSAPTEVVHQLG